MKSFYEMLIILENANRQWTEEEAYQLIDQALKNAGIPWNEDEFNVLYGKSVDMTVWMQPGGTQRIQGIIYPKDIEESEDFIGPHPSGFQINLKEFSPINIIEIHSIKAQKTLNDIIDDWRDERDYENTLRSLPY